MVLAFAVAMIVAALFLLRSEWEKLQLVTVNYRIPTEKEIAFPEETGEERKLRLLFISDLHDYMPARHDREKILAAVEAAGPDAIFFGGDMITISKHKKKAKVKTETILSLAEELAKNYPVFCGEGNHETRLRERDTVAYAEYVSRMFSLGVRYLSDTTVPLITKDGKDTGVSVSGVSLGMEYYKAKPGVGLSMSLPEGYLEERLSPDRKRFNIVLLHHPAFLKEASALGTDLVLSGHMHGGTIRFPDGSGLMTPQYRFFVKECSGQFTKDGTVMIVNRGLGTHSVKLRFNDLPEISVIDIVKT